MKNLDDQIIKLFMIMMTKTFCHDEFVKTNSDFDLTNQNSKSKSRFCDSTNRQIAKMAKTPILPKWSKMTKKSPKKTPFGRIACSIPPNKLMFKIPPLPTPPTPDPPPPSDPDRRHPSRSAPAKTRSPNSE